MKRNRVDSFEQIRDWFCRAFNDKAQNGNAKIRLFEGFKTTLPAGGDLFTIGGGNTGFEETAEGAWEMFFEEWQYYLSNFEKRFTISIGRPEGGASRKFQATVISPEAFSNAEQVSGGMGAGAPFGGGRVAGGFNPAQEAKLYFDLYKTQFENEQLREALNAPAEGIVQQLFANIAESFKHPQVSQMILPAIMGLLSRKAGVPVNIASSGFNAPAEMQQTEAQTQFRARFADYGDAVKELLHNNEPLVFQVMDNLLNIMSDQGKVNKLLAYVFELNAVTSTTGDNFEQ